MTLQHAWPDCTGNWAMDRKRALICCRKCGVLADPTRMNRRAAAVETVMDSALRQLADEGERFVRRHIKGHVTHFLGTL